MGNKLNRVIITQTIYGDFSIEKLEKLETDFKVSPSLAEELFINNCAEFENLPTKFSDFSEFEEPLIMNKDLGKLIAVLEKSDNRVSINNKKELTSIIDFIKNGKKAGKDIQFWM